MIRMLDALKGRISSALEGNRSFVLYRLPCEHELSWIEAEPHEVEVMMDVQELDGLDGFVVAPFRTSETSPILFFPDAQVEHIPFEAESAPFMSKGYGREETTEISPVYKESFSRFATALGAGRLEKLVLSRAEKMPIPEGFSMIESFLLACSFYPESFTYLLFTPLSGIWMGSTPELLLGGDALRWHTMALAGTQTAGEGSDLVEWNTKNLYEHECVVRHIREVLSVGASEVQEHAMETVQAGRVAHLRTRFDFVLEERESMGSWLERMHPTPAVSGLPQGLAYDFIGKYEGYDRGYYTGFIGYLSPQTRTDVFVNLRCMRITGADLILYAGGGIMKNSTLQEEWIETERKMTTMKQILSTRKPSN